MGDQLGQITKYVHISVMKTDVFQPYSQRDIYVLNRRVIVNRRSFLKTFAAIGVILSLPFANSAKAATNHSVDIKAFKFKPAKLDVKVGDTITFTNKDGAPHTATANNRKWGTKTLRRNDSETIAVTADMDTGYFCQFHQNMTGKLVIS